MGKLEHSPAPAASSAQTGPKHSSWRLRGTSPGCAEGLPGQAQPSVGKWAVEPVLTDT